MNRRIVAVSAFLISLALCNRMGWSQTLPAGSGDRVQRAWAMSSPAQRAESVVVGGGVVSQAKYSFHWETRVAPPLPNSLANSFSTQATFGNGAIHRTMYDRDNKTYFGYGVVVEPLPDGNSYRVTFQSLSEWASEIRYVGWTNLPTPRFPLPEVVRNGEILELTLLTNSRTNQRIVDYISIQEPNTPSAFQVPMERAFSYATGPARDLTANDVDLRIKAPRITINGTLEPFTATHADDVSGAFIWFHVPKHGRIILSLGPHPELGFQKAGEVRGTSLEFKLGADTYVLRAGARIAPGPAAFNLYVLHQADWKPTYPFADQSAFTIGAADYFDWIEK